MQRDPLTPEEHVQLARSYEQQGLTKEAMKETQAALKKAPKHVPALLAQGNLALAAGDHKTAEESFKKALKQDEGNAGAKNNLAMLYVAQGKYQEAESLAKAAAESDRMKPYAMETLAQVYENQKRWQEADTAWDAALDAVSDQEPQLRTAIGASRSRFAERRPPTGSN
jgi:tetratricopeptide (TPR) repeat protein